MNPYEITYIVRPDLDEDETRAAVEAVTERLRQANAEIIAVLPWNPPRRRMAYTIRDFGDGFYITTVFRVEPQALAGLENFLKLNDRILRYLLVQATDLNIRQAEQRLQQQQQAAAAPRPQPAMAGSPAAAPAATATPSAPAEGSVVTDPVPAASEAASETAEATETTSEAPSVETHMVAGEEPAAVAVEPPAETQE